MDISLNDFSSRPSELLLEESDHKSWFNRRSVFEKKLIILIICLGVITFGTLLYIIVKSSNEDNACNSPGCLQAASQIIDHVDSTVNPCENFFQFACGKIIKKFNKDWKSKSETILEKQVTEQLLNLVKEQIVNEDSVELKNEKLVFQSCMNETAAEQYSLDIFNNLLTKLDGWPVVVGPSWNNSEFNWSDTILTLRSEGYYHKIFLQLFIGLDEDKKKHIIYINSPYENFYHENELYKNFMIEATVLMGADKNFAEIEISDVYNFMKQLHEVKNNHIKQTRIKISELQHLDRSINWMKFINFYISPVTKLTRHDYIIFPGEKYIKNLQTLLNKTSVRIISNYMIWKVLENVMPFLSKEFKELKNNYDCILKTKIDRSKLCLSLLLYSPIIYMEYANKYLDNRNKEEIKRVFKNIKSEFQIKLEQFSWMTEENKRTILEKLDDLTLSIGGLGKNVDDYLYKLINDGKQVNLKSGFLNLYLNYKKKINTIEFLELSPNASFGITFYYFLITHVAVFYRTHTNILTIPVGLLQNIYYNPDRPMYLNYGAIGKKLGSELVFGIININSVTSKQLDELWSKKTAKGYENYIKCVTTNITDIMDDYFEQIKLAEVGGFKVAYNAYKRWVKENGKEKRLTGIDYTPNQLLWISAAAEQCFDSTTTGYIPHHNSLFQDNEIVRNDPNFSIDFNCPLNSPMNPPHKCEIY